MINAFVGKPGMGKTYSMVKLAIHAIGQGRDVYTNFFIDEKKVNNYLDKKISSTQKFIEKILKLPPKKRGRIIYWRTIHELVDIKSGEILMDEAQIYINSREFRSLPPEFQYKAQQHRKHGVNFWLGVQNIKRIDVVARELVNSVFECKKVLKLFVVREFDIDDIDKTKRQLYSFKISIFSQKIASCYDTLQEITYRRPEK